MSFIFSSLCRREFPAFKVNISAVRSMWRLSNRFYGWGKWGAGMTGRTVKASVPRFDGSWGYCFKPPLSPWGCRGPVSRKKYPHLRKKVFCKEFWLFYHSLCFLPCLLSIFCFLGPFSCFFFRKNDNNSLSLRSRIKVWQYRYIFKKPTRVHWCIVQTSSPRSECGYLNCGPKRPHTVISPLVKIAAIVQEHTQKPKTDTRPCGCIFLLYFVGFF